MPGFGLMAAALNDYTALLPRIEMPPKPPNFCGTNTRAALEAGVFWAVAGGILALLQQQPQREKSPPIVFLTGGDAPLLIPVLPCVEVWPEMTLEGLRHTAEYLS